MIITLVNSKDSQSERYTFKEEEVYIGRNPNKQPSLEIQSHTVSRNHLRVKVKFNKICIKDLNSSNGTFVGGQQIEPNKWLEIQPTDRIKLAQFKGYLIFEMRQETTKNPIKAKISSKIKKIQSDASSQRSRSREEQPSTKRELPFKISESTLKMLKDMTINRKSKQQKIKFLKFLGIGKAGQYWQDIEILIKGKKGGRDTKKATEQLQRQFGLSRNGFEKRGLGM